MCNLSESKIYNAVKKIKTVDGRLDLVRKYPNNIKVFIDYAHTPDALQEVIKSIQNTYNNNVSLVFGCGEREILKKDQ